MGTFVSTWHARDGGFRQHLDAPRPSSQRMKDLKHYRSNGISEDALAPLAAWENAITALPWRIDEPHALAQVRMAYDQERASPDSLAQLSLAIGARRLLAVLSSVGEIAVLDTLDEVVEVLAKGRGPFVLGLPWTVGMEHPSHTGAIEWRGDRLGGHAVAVVGIDRRKARVRVLNNRGTAWGEGGRAWLSLEDVGRILKKRHEAYLLVPGAKAEWKGQ